MLAVPSLPAESFLFFVEATSSVYFSSSVGPPHKQMNVVGVLHR